MSGLRILLIFRAPLGGLFRQVLDLVRHHSAAGHDVGIVADSLTGGERADQVFKDIAPLCSLGIHRLPMHRNPHWSDIANVRRIARIARDLRADVMHGHGSKGGLYARLDAVLRLHGPVRVYTPHGGSFNYLPGTAAHKLYMVIESILERGTDVFAFESQFIANRFYAEVGQTDQLVRIALNGLHPHEFIPRTVAENPTDLVFIGELRPVKGIDMLIESVARIKASGRALTATIVGSGPDEAELKALAVARGVDGLVRFVGPMSAADGMRLGRIMVAPSRFESLPYVVLESVAAQVPLITTDCGGIPEIVGADYPWMLHVGDTDALTQAIVEADGMDAGALQQRAAALAERIRPMFNAERMGNDVIDAYRAAIARRKELTGG